MIPLASRNVRIPAAGLSAPCCILQISDVHFGSYGLYYPEEMRQLTAQIGVCIRNYSKDMKQNAPGIQAIAITGDLLSRCAEKVHFAGALQLLRTLRRFAPVLYALGNHELDLHPGMRAAFFRKCETSGIVILDNRAGRLRSSNICFTGLTLPMEVYKHPDGNFLEKYRHLQPVTESLVRSCVGDCMAHPCVLLAHTPTGFPAYAAWGADVTLSGHVHGGIVRLPVLGGILSPERCFFPSYTRGIYQLNTRNSNAVSNSRYMHVSAGIGKFRLRNPAELVFLNLYAG